MLYLVTLLDSLSYAAVLPLLPDLLAKAGQGAFAGGLLMGLPPLLSFLSAPLFGHLSDRLGRKPVLLISLAGTILAYLAFGLWPTLIGLIVARALAGAMAGSLGVVQAALADQTPPAGRAAAMARLSAAWAVGFTLGPALSLLLSRQEQVTERLAVGLLVAAVGLGVLLAVAGLHHDRPGAEPEDSGTPPDAGPARRRIMLALAMLAFCQAGLLAMSGFLLKDIHGFTAADISAVMVASAVALVATQLLLVPRAVRFLGEAGALRIGLAGLAVAAATLGLVTAWPGATAAGVVVAFCGVALSQAMLTGRLASLAAAQGRGGALGRSNALASLGRVAGPVVLGALFVADARSPFLVVAGLVAVLLAWAPRQIAAGPRN